MLKEIVVLGAGSAGLFAALTLKRKMPQLSVRVVRSPEIGVIGVGESTTPNLPYHLFQYLKLSPRRFYALAEPTWKMGIHFIWGPRGAFEYTFEPQLDVRLVHLARPNGYYCDDDFRSMNLQSALMAQNKAFARQANGGGPEIPPWHAFHLENPKLVKALETFCREDGVEIIDGKMKTAERANDGNIAAIVLEDGQRLTADFFIDASGFRSELLGRVMEEPFISFGSSLFNDRAIVGSWQRGADEPILPYTTAETMDAGWCWRIDHEPTVNRGYVYCSNSISDDQAREEFLRKNPKAKTWDHVVKFRSGRRARGWVGNVMAVGNAGGFVEPLESTSLMVICGQCELFVDLIKHAGVSPTIQQLFNDDWATTWDEIRDFLTLHFWANTRLDTPYWQHCRHDADVSRLKALLEFYEENGPTGFARYHLKGTGNQFGVEGFLIMLVGNRVPHRNRHNATDQERQVIQQMRARFEMQAKQGLNVSESLACIRNPAWRWAGES